MTCPPTLLFAGLIPHDAIRQRPQWLAEGLAREQRVLYLEPHRSVIRGGRLGPGRRLVHDAFCVVTPPAGAAFSGYLPILNRFNARRAANLVRQAVQELGWEEPSAAVATFPKDLDLVTNLRPGVVLYDVMDDYPRFFDPLQRAVLQFMHRALLRRADLVTVSSELLAQRCQPHTERPIQIVNNGIPTGFADNCRVASPAPELGQYPRPRFGYVGTIGDWFDFRAVAKLARTFSTGTVVLVGPVETRLPLLPSNVHLLGVRPHDALPALLRGFDIGLVPFKQASLVDAVNPIKVYEYLAAGLPVLCTPSASVERFGDHVTVASTDDWPASAAACLQKDPTKNSEAYVAPTWKQSVGRLRELLGAQVKASAPAIVDDTEGRYSRESV